MCDSNRNRTRRSKRMNSLLVIASIYLSPACGDDIGRRHITQSQPRSLGSVVMMELTPHYNSYSQPATVDEPTSRTLLFPTPQSPNTYNYSNWTSCTNYTCFELQSLWQFPGKMPQCPGKDCSHNDDDQIKTNHTNSTDGGGGGGNGGGDDDYTGGNGGGGGGSGGGGGGSGGGNGNGGNNDDNNPNHTDDDNGGNNGGKKNDPYTSFSITDCSSYKDFWLWDLSLTCQNSNLKSCQCVTASNLMAMGKLSCPDGSSKAPYCPKDCSICQTCLSMLNCKTPVAPTTPTTKVVQAAKGTNAMPFLIAVAVGILMGVAATYIHKMRQRQRRLNDDGNSSMLSVPLGQAGHDWA